LSYVWGNVDTVRSIFIDDVQFDVTPKLYAALLQLRDTTLPRSLWIDAICIIQANEQEKAFQIQFMASIYGKANQVVVWLGEAKDNSDEALEAIRDAGTESMDDYENRKTEQAVASLLQRDWFQRIWVRQRVLHAFPKRDSNRVRYCIA
jgi:hypothetical protein